MEHYPEAEFKQLPDVVHTDQSVTVNTEITIGDITRPMWLAVTDFKNNGSIKMLNEIKYNIQTINDT